MSLTLCSPAVRTVPHGAQERCDERLLMPYRSRRSPGACTAGCFLGTSRACTPPTSATVRLPSPTRSGQTLTTPSDALRMRSPTVDLRPLCRFANARLVVDSCTGVDLVRTPRPPSPHRTPPATAFHDASAHAQRAPPPVYGRRTASCAWGRGLVSSTTFSPSTSESRPQ